jgi:hypothetical protein
VGLLLVVYCSLIFVRSRRDKINATNVNDKWGEHVEAFEKPIEMTIDTPESELIGV